MRLRVALLLMALAMAPGVSRAQERQPSDTPAEEGSIIGPWVGTYTCGQGLTGISLTITEAHEGRAEALFHFYAVPENPGVPTGCFLQSGSYNAAIRRVTLRGGRWLLQPDGYVTVGFSGQLDRSGRLLTGKVVGPRGCTTFRMERRDQSTAIPAPCRPQVAQR